MLDELELAFEEQGRTRHRHRRSRRGRGRPVREARRGRSLLALFLTLVILGVLGGGVWYGFDKVRDFFSAPDYNSGGSGEVQVEVLPGQTSTDIAQTLYSKGVVKSTKAFVEAARANPHSTDIQPGTYKLHQKMRAADALALMLVPESRVISKVTIPEGLSYKATFALLSQKTGVPLADFEAAAKDPIALGVPDFWFNRTDGKQAIKGLEGFLFPSTYEFEPKSTAERILKTMVAQFLKVAEKLNLVQVAQSKAISPFEALITASLTQAEAGVTEDMPKVARVVYNRLNHKPDPMKLEFDSTTNYWLSLNGQARKPSQHLTVEELNDPKNPYNTANNLGLPPGPIGNPGEDALKAAINPEPGTWLFFVLVDKQGHSAFATTDAEHEKNKALARKNGVL
jgi:UPF0755 protein